MRIEPATSDLDYFRPIEITQDIEVVVLSDHGKVVGKSNCGNPKVIDIDSPLGFDEATPKASPMCCGFSIDRQRDERSHGLKSAYPSGTGLCVWCGVDAKIELTQGNRADILL